MMQAGERQVAPRLDGIRRDHVARYEWAARTLERGSRVVDYACGIGYGAKLLADAGCTVHGFDIDPEAIAYAHEHYFSDRVVYEQDDGESPAFEGDYDVAVCFETLEHLADPRPLLQALRKSARMLIASVPNEDVMPHEYAPGKVYAFHHRHYTKMQFWRLLNETGWEVAEWFGQAGPESEVEAGIAGRTLIAVARPFGRKLQAEVPEAVPAPIALPVPEHVAILGNGPSLRMYLEIAKRQGGRSKFCDQTWGINALGDVFACDLVFHMDDIRIQEIRAAAKPDGNIAAMVRWMKTHPGPIVTSRAHADYPGLVAYPLEAVVNDLGFCYFNSTSAYAVAYAVHLGVKKISCFGLDFTYAHSHHAEKGRACVEFYLGIAAARGIKLSMPKESSLMDACTPGAEHVYGYDTLDVRLKRDGDQVRVEFEEKAALPSAAEIEARYDHTLHPSPLIETLGEQP